MSLYTDENTLRMYIPAEVLVDLTDDIGNNEIGQDNLTYAIQMASDMIDGYIRGRYAVPIIDIPPMVKDIATKLAVYFLLKRSLFATVPDPIKEDYDWCQSVLTKMQKGFINPFDVSQNPPKVISNKNPLFDTPVGVQITNGWASFKV